MKARQDVAVMLRAGATHARIRVELHVSDWLIRRTRIALDIPVPPERAKRRPAEVVALDDQALAMLRAGATYDEIRAALRLSPNRIARLRRQHNIPVTRRPGWAPPRFTIDEAFARHTQPTPEGGHLIWTGPRSGRGYDLIASGRTHNARHIAFRKHHGRDPEGQTRRTCDQTDCIAGAHLTDRTLREATP
ncbi:hypothetical protein PV516_40700 [Streptomyces scabiei]|uniref:hypothetical protein n=1 Tax=Streptomyces scabiei TaxID=1930 RepID=UPI0029A6A28B|nr:hypothetical protein [Streptomyces scabiei]MDX3170084.1 hypothetical protein [Streptomyces scabiei]